MFGKIWYLVILVRQLTVMEACWKQKCHIKIYSVVEYTGLYSIYYFQVYASPASLQSISISWCYLLLLFLIDMINSGWWIVIWSVEAAPLILFFQFFMSLVGEDICNSYQVNYFAIDNTTQVVYRWSGCLLARRTKGKLKDRAAEGLHRNPDYMALHYLIDLAALHWKSWCQKFL